jgi:hypothetical protein
VGGSRSTDLRREVVDVADERTLPFKERAYQNYREEIDDLRKIEALLNEKNESEIENYREPLSCDERREVTILLSWGGPSDGYKVYFDKDGEAAEGFYFFADWFEYEEFKLSDKELDSVLAVYPVAADLPIDWLEPKLPKLKK